MHPTGPKANAPHIPLDHVLVHTYREELRDPPRPLRADFGTMGALYMFHEDLLINWHCLWDTMIHELRWEADLKPGDFVGKPMGSRSVFVGSQFCNAYKALEKCGKFLRPVSLIISLLPLSHRNGAHFSTMMVLPAAP